MARTTFPDIAASSLNPQSECRRSLRDPTWAGRSIGGAIHDNTSAISVHTYPLMISADEVIIRYIRVRFGDESGKDADAISARYVKNLILDHVSAMSLCNGV